MTTEDWKDLTPQQADGRAYVVCSGNWITIGFYHSSRHCWCVDAPDYAPYPADEQPEKWLMLVSDFPPPPEEVP